MANPYARTLGVCGVDTVRGRKQAAGHAPVHQLPQPRPAASYAILRDPNSRNSSNNDNNTSNDSNNMNNTTSTTTTSIDKHNDYNNNDTTTNNNDSASHTIIIY